MKNNTKDKLHVVIYEQDKHAKLFQIKKHLIKPFIILLCLSVFISWGLSTYILIERKSIVDVAKLQESSKITTLKKEIEELKATQNATLEENKDLLKKISEPSNETEVSLGLIAPPRGMKDRRGEKLLITDTVNYRLNKQREIVFSFNLQNNHPQQKRVVGHIIVLVKGRNAVSFYPNNQINNSFPFLNYNTGEVFGTSRFRPVSAVFKNISIEGPLYFEVLVFSSLGDLLHEESFGPYEHTK